MYKDDGIHESMKIMKKMKLNEAAKEKKLSDNAADAVIMSGPVGNDYTPLTQISVGKILELVNGMQCKVANIKMEAGNGEGFATYISIFNVGEDTDDKQYKKYKAEDLMKLVVGEVKK